MPFNPLLYNEKYRIPTNRLQDKSYGKGFYHIVLCAKERIHYFGEIQNNEMQYSNIGEFTKDCIERLHHFYPYATILAFQVMPNHIHLLLSLSDAAPVASIGETARNTIGETARNAVSTGRHQSGLAIVIAGFKRTITWWAKNNNVDFAWQPRYYDTVIRNANQYNETNYYIHNNVLNWNNDELNTYDI